MFRVVNSYQPWQRRRGWRSSSKRSKESWRRPVWIERWSRPWRDPSLSARPPVRDTLWVPAADRWSCRHLIANMKWAHRKTQMITDKENKITDWNAPHQSSVPDRSYIFHAPSWVLAPEKAPRRIQRKRNTTEPWNTHDVVNNLPSVTSQTINRIS